MGGLRSLKIVIIVRHPEIIPVNVRSPFLQMLGRPVLSIVRQMTSLVRSLVQQTVTPDDLKTSNDGLAAMFDFVQLL